MKLLKKIIIFTILGVVLVGCGKKNEDTVKIPKVNVCDYDNIDLSANKDKNLENSEYVMQYLLDNTVYNDYPQDEVDGYIESSKIYYEEYAAMVGVDYPTYIKEFLQKDVATFEEEIKQSGIDYVKEKYILLNIAKKEGLEFTEKDYDKYLEDLIAETGYGTVEEFKNTVIANNQEEDMKEAAYLDMIVEHILELNRTE